MQLTLAVCVLVVMVISASFAGHHKRNNDDKHKDDILGEWEVKFGQKLEEEAKLMGYASTMAKVMYSKGSEFDYKKLGDNLYSVTISSKATGTVTRTFVPGKATAISWDYNGKRTEVMVTHTYEGNGTWKTEVEVFDPDTGKPHVTTCYKTAKGNKMTWKFEGIEAEAVLEKIKS